jgi:peroxiredoxin
VHELKGLPAGAFLSDFALQNLAGEYVRVSDLVGGSYLLVFVSRDCEPSAEVLSHFGALRGMDIELPKTVVICSGGVDAARAVAGRFDLGTDVVVQDDNELSLFMRVPATPAAYRVNADRTTAGPLAIGADAVLAMLPRIITPFEPDDETHDDEPRATLLARSAGLRRRGLPVGELAPEIPDIVGRWDDGLIARNRGWWTLLVFWSPDCTPCDDTAGLLADLVTAAPHLSMIVVSRGTQLDARSLAEALGSTATVVPQQGRSISRQYAALDAPSAYLIDPEGRIAEPLARGRLAVAQLLARARERAGATEPPITE